MPLRAPKNMYFYICCTSGVLWTNSSGSLAHSTSHMCETDGMGLHTSREALLVDPRHDSRVKMAFWSTVFRGVRLRVPGAPETPVLFMSGYHEKGPTILEGRTDSR